MSLDRAVDEWLLHHRTPVLTDACRAMMWVGTPGPGFWLFGAAVVLASLWRRRPATIAAVGIAVLGTSWVNIAVKHLVQRPRPGPEFAMVPAPGWSMPSTAVAVTTAGLVAMWALAPASRRGRRALATCFVLLDLAVAFAVVYLGTHWCSDTAVGALEGGTLGLLVHGVHARATRWWRHRRPAREGSGSHAGRPVGGSATGPNTGPARPDGV